ncbi:MAG: septal ring lytic transglycosylase RlpA family protein [Candidatus Andeanibacterium colombiense]|uniref:Endolytic peptidoglycan transglycosylase RlpA n=1 Tax=Candidatus Andeanibacterium colombiense TaxID=3121345 RepID=A0AAJ6BPN9_9SPHN|nr:MAG: septal ring lytic transglycosylase RlpA family protein [Sphingomonadaceae bacterium]
MAALLLGAAGASVPGTGAYAEIQPTNARTAMLVPAAIQAAGQAATQPTGFRDAFAAYAPVPPVPPATPAAAASEEAGPRFVDPAAIADTGRAIDGGKASYYGREFAGHRTASGARFDPAGFTAAHRSLPFGSKVRVTNTRTGASVVVTINDRGPFARDRVIDVSQAAARELGLIGPGSGKVSLSVLDD